MSAACATVVVAHAVCAQQPAHAETGRIPAGALLRISVPDAFGGKTVIGQLTVDQVVGAGFVTAFGCDDGLPTDANGDVTRSDLNYDSRTSPVASNRLIVKADADGDVCFYTMRPAALIVDINAVTFDTGVTSFVNRRTDTRTRAEPRVGAGGLLRVAVPEATGGRTVVGQLTVDLVVGAGFVTAFGCDDGLPTDANGDVTRSDLNYDSRTSPVASNRLIVKADADGDVCFYTMRPAALIVDVNGVADVGIASFPNQRTDTRHRAEPRLAAGGIMRLSVPEAVGAKTVIGQLTVDGIDGAGFVTAFGCDDGLPVDANGDVTRSDLNYDRRIAPVASNRLIVKADADGDVCFYTLGAASLIVDVNAVAGAAINSFPNQRTDTRTGTSPVTSPTTNPDGIPVWPPLTPLAGLSGVAALTGLPADATITQRPIVAVKIDNYSVARPQWALDQADAVIELNVEGISRFVALFHTNLPTALGPVRSARTSDLDLLTAMNRPVFAFSGANPSVTAWVDSAASSGQLVDFDAQHSPCYSRSPDRVGPHNLLLDATCAVQTSTGAGPARPLWAIDASWSPVAGVTALDDSTFAVAMDGVRVEWTWDAASGAYLRSQDGQPHVAVSGTRLSARNVVVIAASHVPSPVDSRSPNPITVGSGIAVVHRDGKAIPATWSRPTPYVGFEFRDAITNQSIPLDTGTTFVELERG